MAADLTVRSDSLSAIMAIKAQQRHDHPSPFAPSSKLVRQIVTNIESHTGTTELKWVKAHVGIAGNELADQAANQALSKPSLKWAPTEGDDFCVILGDQRIDADFTDAIQQELLKQHMEDLAASQLVSGQWYTTSINDHSAHKLPPEERTWAFKTRGHALPSACRACLMFPNGNISPKCALCKEADDTATHWYQCLALQQAWKEELAIADKRAPWKGGKSWFDVADREKLAQGLIPRTAKIEVPRQRAAGETAKASHCT